MICPGSASRSVHSRAWSSNSSSGSRTNTQRKGTAGNPVLYQPAVSETSPPVLSSPPYQPVTVTGVHTVAESSATTERLGKRSPLRRGLPIRLGWRGGGGSERGGASRKRGGEAGGVFSLRQRTRGFRGG